MQKIKNASVLDVIRSMDLQGNVAKLNRVLDRKLYTDVDKVLKAAGGKWNKRIGGHVFGKPSEEALASVLANGAYHDVKQDDNLFETPEFLVDEMIGIAKDYFGSLSGRATLEPSAGRGNIIRGLVKAGATWVITKDFLSPEFDGSRHTAVELVMMNPPFKRGSDINHVRKAYDLLNDGGLLVAIMSPSWQYRADKKGVSFREWVSGQAQWGCETNPEGSFESEGTKVRTVLFWTVKPLK